MCKVECRSNTQLRRNYLLLELRSLAFSTYVDLNGYGRIIYYKAELYLLTLSVRKFNTTWKEGIGAPFQPMTVLTFTRSIPRYYMASMRQKK